MFRRLAIALSGWATTSGLTLLALHSWFTALEPGAAVAAGAAVWTLARARMEGSRDPGQ